MLTRASIFLDPDRQPPTVAARFVDQLTAFDFSPLQARFAAEVMYLGGVFLQSQADLWLSGAWPEYGGRADPIERSSYCARFLQDLFAPVGSLKPLARSYRVPGSAAEYGHFNSRYFYRLVGLGYSRYQRMEKAWLAVARLLNFDYIVRHPEYVWYGATQQKEQLFDSLDVPRSSWPVRHYRAETKPSGPTTPAYFPDHSPVGLRGWHVLFLFPLHYGLTPGGLRANVKAYGSLWAQLRRRGLRVTAVVCHRPGTPAMAVHGVAAPPDQRDYRLLANVVWRYLLQLAVELNDTEVIDAQGGLAAVREQHRQLLREASAVKLSATGPMAVETHECSQLASGRP